MLVPVVAALPDADDLAVDVGHHHQTIGDGGADMTLVPPVADLLIGRHRADQRGIVRSNMCLAEPTDARNITLFRIPYDRFGHDVSAQWMFRKGSAGGRPPSTRCR